MATPVVALLIETSREYGRGLLRGIIRYQREHGPWSVYFKPQGLGDPPPRWLARWRGDGILARINDRHMAEVVLKTGLPAVDLRGAVGELGLPVVGVDNRAVIRLAVRHFLDRGFRHFAFCGTPRGENCYQDERADRFQDSLARHGFNCHLHLGDAGRGAQSWEDEQRQIVDWLRSLEKPLAVMACNDDRGHQMLDACLRAGLHVPDEVAILGVDNDPLLCALSTPPLSSVDVHPERIGYEAAATLTRMMRGRAWPKRYRGFAPRDIVTRQSTDVMAVEDQDVAHAVRLIRAHACSSTSIDQLLRQVGVSRSTLFRRFTQSLGRSPKEEMTRVRLERAKELLRETRLPIHAIAERVGYSEAKYFSEVFHAAFGETALKYRRQTAAKRP